MGGQQKEAEEAAKRKVRDDRRLFAREEGLCVTLSRRVDDAAAARCQVRTLLLSLGRGSRPIRTADAIDIANFLGHGWAVAESRRVQEALLRLRAKMGGQCEAAEEDISAAAARGDVYPRGAKNSPQQQYHPLPHQDAPGPSHTPQQHADPAAGGAAQPAEESLEAVMGEEEAEGVRAFWELLDPLGRGLVDRTRVAALLRKMGSTESAVAEVLQRTGCPPVVTRKDFEKVVQRM
eukprot:Hpha_TRINITY_DN16121_c2_g4::TRINITY_DN16121_c2_g4_i1::g.4213::m.4213